MLIRIRVFAILREVAKSELIELELPENSTTAELLNRLSEILPSARGVILRSAIAVNGEYWMPQDVLPANAEICVIPPVSGGEGSYLTREPINLNELMVSVTVPEAGAVVIFLGTIRNHSEGKKVLYLEYEAYEKMADKMIGELVQQAKKKWPLHQIALKHRLGKIELTEPSIAIYVSSSHRADAYEASRFLIDEIKNKVPIWKKEYFSDSSQWSGGTPVQI